jgi:hypothetical protein
MPDPTGPKLGPKLVPFPSKPAAPEVSLSPQEDVIDQAYAVRKQIKNIAIFAHLEDGGIRVFNAIHEDIDLWSFVEAIKLRALKATNDYLSGPVLDPQQIS